MPLKESDKRTWEENYNNKSLSGIEIKDANGKLVNFILVRHDEVLEKNTTHRITVKLDEKNKPIFPAPQTFDQLIQAKRRQQMILFGHPTTSSSSSASLSSRVARKSVEFAKRLAAANANQPNHRKPIAQAIRRPVVNNVPPQPSVPAAVPESAPIVVQTPSVAKEPLASAVSNSKNKKKKKKSSGSKRSKSCKAKPDNSEPSCPVQEVTLSPSLSPAAKNNKNKSPRASNPKTTNCDSKNQAYSSSIAEPEFEQDSPISIKTEPRDTIDPRPGPSKSPDDLGTSGNGGTGSKVVTSMKDLKRKNELLESVDPKEVKMLLKSAAPGSQIELPNGIVIKKSRRGGARAGAGRKRSRPLPAATRLSQSNSKITLCSNQSSIRNHDCNNSSNAAQSSLNSSTNSSATTTTTGMLNTSGSSISSSYDESNMDQLV